MDEYWDKSNEEMASCFIISTCQMQAQPYARFSVSDCMHDSRTTDLASKFHDYGIVCGSQAEFYIHPLNTCIDDVDYLGSCNNVLIFSGEYPVLPSDQSALADTIECCKIESYPEYPGFFRLKVFGDMNYDWKSKKYEFNHEPQLDTYVLNDIASVARCDSLLFVDDNNTATSVIVCGPSIKLSTSFQPNFGIDSVFCIYCPAWPTEAHNFQIRDRYHGWPTMDTISEVVESGCHVVYAHHRACRDDKLQWRFSFSFAEIILLQSWTQIQQIVYHLLRFFSKRELIQKNCAKEDEVLCPYHLKTLMLWTCEEMSLEWWNSASVISICCELLRKLSVWLKKRHCPNYFIPEANLFHEQFNDTMLRQTEERLNEFRNSDILSHWFTANYIMPVVERQLLFLETGKVKPHFIDYVLPLIEYRKSIEMESVCFLLSLSFADSCQICPGVIRISLSSEIRNNLRPRQKKPSTRFYELQRERAFLPTADKASCFKYSNILPYILIYASALQYGQLSLYSSLFVEFVQELSMQPNILKSAYHNFPKMYTEQKSRFHYLRAQSLMEMLTGPVSRPECQLLTLLSKEFLAKALEIDSFMTDGITPAALAYLAALHFVTSEYQQTMRLCSALLSDQPPRKDEENLNAGCLLFIDDVARIVGLRVLHEKIIKNSLEYVGGRIYLDLRLSPAVFAHYLAVKSAERISRHYDFNHGLPDSAYPMDEYLKASRKPKFIAALRSGNLFIAAREIVYRTTDSLIQNESTNANALTVKERVINTLIRCGLENMKSFDSVIREDFGIPCNTYDVYRALYFYKCHQFNEAWNLCERILQEPVLHLCLNVFSFENVLVLPPLDSYFDSEIQCLLGLHTLFHYLSPLNKDIGELEYSGTLTFKQWFAKYVYFKRFHLSASLWEDIYVKCNYFLGRHFLARYLKVRCRINCNLTYAEELKDFAVHKTNLPFERIIRRFLLRKLR